MGQAVLTFFGVILGATIAGGISLWQVQLVTRREREARQAIREQESKDRRDAFQRETILALQDVMDMLTAYLRARDEKREADTKAGKWTRRDDLSPYPPDFAEASRHIYRLRARIFDDELRKLGGDLRVQMGLALFAASERLERHSFNSASGLSNEAHDRMHVLLQQHL